MGGRTRISAQKPWTLSLTDAITDFSLRQTAKSKKHYKPLWHFSNKNEREGRLGELLIYIVDSFDESNPSLYEFHYYWTYVLQTNFEVKACVMCRTSMYVM